MAKTEGRSNVGVCGRRYAEAGSLFRAEGSARRVPDKEGDPTRTSSSRSDAAYSRTNSRTLLHLVLQFTKSPLVATYASIANDFLDEHSVAPNLATNSTQAFKQQCPAQLPWHQFRLCLAVTQSDTTSTRTAIMVERSLPLLALTSPSLLVTRARQRDSTSKPATRRRSSVCEYHSMARPLAYFASCFVVFSDGELTAYSPISHRTDKAVLAVNGFAADGNMFVKKVKQRLEVCTRNAQ